MPELNDDEKAFLMLLPEEDVKFHFPANYPSNVPKERVEAQDLIVQKLEELNLLDCYHEAKTNDKYCDLTEAGLKIYRELKSGAFKAIATT